MCHQIDGNGADYGPGLKGWGPNQPREAIVRAIAEPSAEIALGYNGTEVLLKDGGVVHGIAFNNQRSRNRFGPAVGHPVHGRPHSADPQGAHLEKAGV